MRSLTLYEWTMILALASILLALLAVVMGVRELSFGIGIGLGTLWAMLIRGWWRRRIAI